MVHALYSSAKREEPYNCIGNFGIIFVFLWFARFACVPLMFYATENLSVLFFSSLSLIFRLFCFLSSTALRPRNLKHFVPLDQNPRQRLARFGCFPLDLHHYTFAGHRNPIDRLFSLLPDVLAYRQHWCIPYLVLSVGTFVCAPHPVWSFTPRWVFPVPPAPIALVFSFLLVDVCELRCFVTLACRISRVMFGFGYRFRALMWH